MCRISRLNSISTIAACIVAYAPLMAQATTGTLAGTVKNKNGETIAGVLVRLTSPNLMLPRETKSDERGNWRFGLLPPGEYRVVFSKEGYVSSSRQNVRVGLDTIIRADIALTPIGIATETVEVIAEGGGTIDKSDTKVSTNFSAEQLEALGYSSLSGAASLAAGAVESEAGGFSVRGATITDTLFRMDGVDIKNDFQGNVSGTRYLADMIEDIQVNLSPVHPRYGRTTGGSVNVATKSGSNTFSATARAYLNKSNAWTANRRGILDGDFDEGGRYTDNWSTKRYDITLLGPVIKDRLWFSFGTSFTPGSVTNRIMTSWPDYPDINYGPMKFATNATTVPATAVEINQKLLDGPDGYYYPEFDALKHFQERTSRDYYQGKLTWTFFQDHTLEYSFSLEKTLIANRDSTTSATAGYVMVSMLGTQSTENSNWGMNYKGVFGTSTLVEARCGSSVSDIQWPNYLHPTVQDPIMIWIGRKANTGGGPGQLEVNAFTARRAGVGNEIRGNKGWAINAKHYWYGLGQHESEVGIESHTGRLRRGSAYGPSNRRYSLTGVYLKEGITDVNDPRAEWMFGSGPYIGMSLNGQSSTGRSGPAAVWRQYFGVDGEQNPISTSFYAADQWNVNDHLSGMVGFRFEKYNINNTDGSELASSSQFIPRASLKYDPTGTSKHLLTLNYALYASDFYTGFTNAFASNASSTYSDVGWTGRALGQQPYRVTADETVPPEVLAFFTYQDLINPENWKREDGNFNSFRFESAGDTFFVDKNMKPPVAHEVSFRYQRQFDNKSLFSIGLTQKKWRQLWAIWQEHDPRQWVRLTDPFGSNDVIYAQMIRYGNSDKLKRDYFGLEVDFNHIMTKVWSLRTAIGYSTLKGNDEGGDSEGGGWNQPADTFRDNSTTPMFNNRNLILGAMPPSALGKDRWDESDFAPYGYLRSHQLLKGRVTLVGRFPLHRGGHVTLSWVAEYDTARANSPTANVRVGTLDREYPLPTIGTLPSWNENFTRHYMARGAWSNNDNFRVVMNASWQVPLGMKKMSLVGNFQLYNLFNNMRQIGIYRSYLSGSGEESMFPVAYDVSRFGTTQPGTANEWRYHNTGRYATTSIGLRF